MRSVPNLSNLNFPGDAGLTYRIQIEFQKFSEPGAKSGQTSLVRKDFADLPFGVSNAAMWLVQFSACNTHCVCCSHREEEPEARNDSELCFGAFGYSIFQSYHQLKKELAESSECFD